MSGQDIKQIIITAMLCGTIITALILLYKVDKNAKNDNEDNHKDDKNKRYGVPGITRKSLSESKHKLPKYI